jgi:nitrogen fixation-related uncharacterized protein
LPYSSCLPCGLQWGLFLVEIVLITISLIIAIVSFILLLWLVKNGVFGYELDYDPDTIDPKILKAITPIKAQTNGDKPRVKNQP